MIRTSILAAAMSVLAVSGASAATVFADDFSSDTSGSASLNNWNVDSGNIEVVGVTFYPMYGSDNKVDLNGTSPASISRAFANLAAGTYTLSFDYGNNTGSNGVEQLTYGIGGLTNIINIPGAIANLITVSVTFNWTGGATSLFFTDSGTASPFDSGGPILDNVSLVSTVPLPAGAPMLLAGLLGFAALRRRKSA